MKNCPNEREIDGYILGRLSEDGAREFEIHYFNCPACFEKMQARETLIEAVARKREELLAPRAARRAGGVRVWFARRPWMAVAATAGVVLMIAAGVILRPSGRGAAVPDESVVRGQALAAISPAGDVNSAPGAFSWHPGPPGLEFRVELTGPGLSWSAPADATAIALPKDVRAKLERGVVYTWQVKGYARDGTLLVRSNKTTFRIK
jgi:hypothetical protein